MVIHHCIIPCDLKQIAFQCLVAYQFAAGQAKKRKDEKFGWLKTIFDQDFFIEPEVIEEIGNKLIVEGRESFPKELTQAMPDVQFSIRPIQVSPEDIYDLFLVAQDVKRSSEAMGVLNGLRLQKTAPRTIDELLQYLREMPCMQP